MLNFQWRPHSSNPTKSTLSGANVRECSAITDDSMCQGNSYQAISPLWIVAIFHLFFVYKKTEIQSHSARIWVSICHFSPISGDFFGIFNYILKPTHFFGTGFTPHWSQGGYRIPGIDEGLNPAPKKHAPNVPWIFTYMKSMNLLVKSIGNTYGASGLI